jgi:hypothetical protein
MCGGLPALALAAEVVLGCCSGRWTVIANIPYFAGKGNVGGYFDSSRQVGDTLADVCSVHPGDFGIRTKLFFVNGLVLPCAGDARCRESAFRPL